VTILPKPLSFEWDSGNLDKNFLKHQVSNREAEEVFSSNPKLLFVEQRHMIWGKTNQERLLSVIFKIRSTTIRVISARDLNKKERRFYEKTT